MGSLLEACKYDADKARDDIAASAVRAYEQSPSKTEQRRWMREILDTRWVAGFRSGQATPVDRSEFSRRKPRKKKSKGKSPMPVQSDTQTWRFEAIEEDARSASLIKHRGVWFATITSKSGGMAERTEGLTESIGLIRRFCGDDAAGAASKIMEGSSAHA